MKSSEHTSKELNDTLMFVVNLLNENNIQNWFISYGTLLGIIRNNSCIDRDDDIDIIIDKNLNKVDNNEDLFKIREKRAKLVDKKRGTGIPTFKGAICATAKDKQSIIKLVRNMPNINKADIIKLDNLTRDDICLELRDKLLYLEKYSTSEDNNKKTYIMIPSNHPTYPFPYNLEDRLKFIISQINKLAGRQVDIIVKKQKNKLNNIVYEMTFTHQAFFKDKNNLLEKIGFKLINNTWINLLE